MKNKARLLMIIILGLFIFVGCTNQPTPTPESTPTPSVSPSVTPEVSEPSFTLNVIDKKQDKIFEEVILIEETDLYEIIMSMSELKIVSKESEAGMIIESIMDISFGDNYYWNVYVNGQPLEDNVIDYEVKDKDVIEFHFQLAGK